jgi:hypothetical protein
MPPAIGRRNGGTMLTLRGRCGRGSRRGRGGQIERRKRREDDKVKKEEDIPMQGREKLEWGHCHHCHCCHRTINEEEEEDDDNARGGLGLDQGCNETSTAVSELVKGLASLNGN